MNFAKRLITAKDVVRVEDGRQLVSILKIDHPHRQQRLMIVPTPRFASEDFYKEWCYQPYVKDHNLLVSNDIFNPAYMSVPRLVLANTTKYGDVKYFTPVNMPDGIDSNVDRRDYVQRERPFGTPAPFILLTTNGFRDSWHPWVNRRIRKLVGERYVTHPHETEQSYVLLLPPAYAASAANSLQELGFKISDKVVVDAGDQTGVKALLFYGDVAQFAVLSYFWIIIVVMIMNESRRFMGAFRDYQIYVLLMAGKDVKEYGFEDVSDEERERIIDYFTPAEERQQRQ